MGKTKNNNIDSIVSQLKIEFDSYEKIELQQNEILNKNIPEKNNAILINLHEYSKKVITEEILKKTKCF